MKTNPASYWIVKIRVVLLCLIIGAIAGIEVAMTESLATRIGHFSGCPADNPQVPSLSFDDLMVAGR